MFWTDILAVAAWFFFATLVIFRFRARVVGAMRRVPWRFSWSRSGSATRFWDEIQRTTSYDHRRDLISEVKAWPVVDEWFAVSDRNIVYRALSILEKLEKREGMEPQVAALLAEAKSAVKAVYKATGPPPRVLR
jgi:hypothetical protein